MLVSFIGSGNVATVLAKRMFAKGITIHEIFSRNESNAKELAQQVNANIVTEISQLSKNADVYIIGVSDKVLPEIVSQLSFKNKLVLHTAGSVSINVLKNMSEEFGVLYPVQSLRKTMSDETPIPFLIDGNKEDVFKKIELLAKIISHKTAKCNDESRLKAHVACVFACNFANYMYLQSEAFCKAENLDFSIIQDLMEETANRLRNNSPQDVFTGPAVRGDVPTIEKHLQLLKKYPSHHQLYQLISKSIMNLKK